MGFSPWAVKKGLLCGRTHSGRSSATGSAAAAALRRLLSPSASASASSPSRSSVAVPVPVRERRRSVLPIQIAPPYPPTRRTPPPTVGPRRLRLPVKIRHRAAVLRCLRLLSEIRSTAQPLLCTSASATKLLFCLRLTESWWPCVDLNFRIQGSDILPLSAEYTFFFRPLRFLSAAGRLLGKDRTSMSPETLEASICLKDWIIGFEDDEKGYATEGSRICDLEDYVE
uniref:HAT C-terminal dimerisation domain-containing protein n=1 Tax=Oryza nivara TaxID=4536 RepID=A0A0E0GHY0_ORYNI